MPRTGEEARLGVSGEEGAGVERGRQAAAIARWRRRVWAAGTCSVISGAERTGFFEDKLP